MPDKDSLDFARAINLVGLLYLDTNKPRKALDCFSKGLEVRQRKLPSNDAFIASSLSNVALAHTELQSFNEAMEYQNQAIQIRLETNSPMIGNSYSNMASCLLRMGKPDEAEEMLRRCPSLKDMNDESFLRADNPRFAR